MDIVKRLAGRTWQHFMHDSLRRNSLLLTMSQVINAGSGFLFWIICARLFQVHDIGLASAFIAYGSLISTFTNLGITNTIIRFMPQSENQRGLFNAVLVIMSITSLFGGLVAVLLIRHVAPQLGFVEGSLVASAILIGAVLFNTITTITDGALLSFRKGQYVLGKAVISSGSKLLLIFSFTSLGVIGILLPYTLAIGLCIGFSLWVILTKLIKRSVHTVQFDYRQLYHHRSFALGNFSGTIVGVLPGSLVPIIVLNQLGAEQAAYFFITFQIALFLNLICSSVSQAFFSEASQQDSAQQMRQNLRKAFNNMYLLLLPVVIVLGGLGYFILSIYGLQYANNSYSLLVLLLAASLFIGINWLGDAWLNIQKKMRAYFVMNTLNAVLVVGLIYLLAKYGLVWVGIGWLTAQGLSAAAYVVVFEGKNIIRRIQRFKTSS